RASDHPPLHSFPTRRSSDLRAQSIRTSFISDKSWNQTRKSRVSFLPFTVAATSLWVSIHYYESVDQQRRSIGSTYAKGFRRATVDRKSTRLNSSHVAISYAV